MEAEILSLLEWVRSFFPCDTIETFILEGIYWKMLQEIGPRYASSSLIFPATPHSGQDVVKVGRAFSEALQAFDVQELHFPLHSTVCKVDWTSIADWVTGGEQFMKGECRVQSLKVTKALLGAAVKCDDKQRFIGRITTLSPSTQASLMRIIQSELLKEPVPSAEDKAAEAEHLKNQASELLRLQEETKILRERNAVLLTTVRSLEVEVEKGKGTRGDDGDSGKDAKQALEESAALREKLRLLQDELVRRDEEHRAAEAAAAEAAARLREARIIKDELDLAREKIALLQGKLDEARATSSGGISGKEAAALKEELKASQEEVVSLRDAKAEAIKVKKELSQLKSDLTRVKVDLEEAQRQASVRKEEAERLSAQYVSARAEIGTLSSQLDTSRMEISQLKLSTSTTLAGGSFNTSASEGNSLFDEMSEDANEKLKKQLQELKQERDALQAEVTEWREGSEEERNQIKTLMAAQAEKHQEELNKLRHELEQAKSEKGSVVDKPASNDESTRLREELMSAKAQLQVMQQKHADASKSWDQEREQLKNYLKMAKEKLMNDTNKAAPPVVQQAPGGDVSGVELKMMASHVHMKGLEILKLRHEIESLKRQIGQQDKDQGLLNNLRRAL